MSSLTSPGLIKAMNDAIVKASPDLNLARLFAYDMSDEFADYGYTVKVPLAGHGTVSGFNMSTNDYETVDGTVTYATVQLNKQPKSTFEFTGNDVLEAPNAPYWNKVAIAAADGIKGAISYDIGQLFADTALSNDTTLASVTKANLAKLRNACAGRVADTVLALAPAEYADALALFDSNVIGDSEAIKNGVINGLYGFKAVIQLKDLPSGVKGALIPSNAVAVASRAVAVGDDSCYREIGTVSDEFGFTMTVMRHGSAAKGKGFLNVTTLWGAKVVQPDAITLIK